MGLAELLGALGVKGTDLSGILGTKEAPVAPQETIVPVQQNIGRRLKAGEISALLSEQGLTPEEIMAEVERRQRPTRVKW